MLQKGAQNCSRAVGCLAGARPNYANVIGLSQLLQALPDWLALPASTPVVFFCRSGNRSAQAAGALRRLGHDNAWSLAGGVALWRPEAVDELQSDAVLG